MASVTAGCSADQHGSQLHGYSLGDDQMWPGGRVPMCWENGTEATADWRAATERTIETAYASVPGLHFSGWQACQGRERSLHIEVYGDGPTPYESFNRPYSGHPRATALGRQVSGLRPGLILNPTLTNVQPGLVEQVAGFDSVQMQHIQAAIAIHEVGHALGLLHEQARPDSGCSDYPDSGLGGGVERGAYDPESIMNYCVTHTRDFRQALELSPGDIANLNGLYPQSR